MIPTESLLTLLLPGAAVEARKFDLEAEMSASPHSDKIVLTLFGGGRLKDYDILTRQEIDNDLYKFVFAPRVIAAIEDFTKPDAKNVKGG